MNQQRTLAVMGYLLSVFYEKQVAMIAKSHSESQACGQAKTK
jgi:hypothetical protein